MKRGNAAGTVATLALTCVFGVTMLLGILAGASLYQRVGDRVNQSAQERIGLTYITAKIHGFDALQTGGASAVRVGDVNGSDALFFLEDIDGVAYETILYVCDGQLMEMLCMQGADLDPALGEVIGPAQSLEISQPGKNLLRLSFTGADGTKRTADVELRSGGTVWGNG